MAGITFSEGSGVNDSIFGKSTEPIKMFLEKRAEQFEAESVLPELFDIEDSTHYGEKITGLTAMNGFQPVGENGAYPHDNMREGYSKFLENMTWKDAFSISKEMIDDAKIMDMRRKPQNFIAGYYRTREEFGAALFGAAITEQSSISFRGRTFDTTAADGKGLFATDHLGLISGKTQSNKFADAFSADALAAAECAMQDFRGDNDELLATVPTTIIIPNLYALKKAVFAAIGADKDPNTANNGFNFIFGRWNVIVWGYLNRYITAGTAPWILCDPKSNKESGGAVWLEREPINVRTELAGNDATEWKGRARFIGGFGDWHSFCVGGISGGTQLISE